MLALLFCCAEAKTNPATFKPRPQEALRLFYVRSPPPLALFYRRCSCGIYGVADITWSRFDKEKKNPQMTTVVRLLRLAAVFETLIS